MLNLKSWSNVLLSIRTKIRCNLKVRHSHNDPHFSSHLREISGFIDEDMALQFIGNDEGSDDFESRRIAGNGSRLYSRLSFSIF